MGNARLPAFKIDIKKREELASRLIHLGWAGWRSAWSGVVREGPTEQTAAHPTPGPCLHHHHRSRSASPASAMRASLCSMCSSTWLAAWHTRKCAPHHPQGLSVGESASDSVQCRDGDDGPFGLWARPAHPGCDGSWAASGARRAGSPGEGVVSKSHNGRTEVFFEKLGGVARLGLGVRVTVH